MSGTCRLCLSPGASRRIFQGGTHLTKRIRHCCRLRINKNDGLTDWICLHCIMMLDKLTSFINICKESDNVLRANTITNSNESLEIKEKHINLTDLEPVCNLQCDPSIKCIIDDSDKLMIKEEIKSNHSEDTSDNILDMFDENDYATDFLGNNNVEDTIEVEIPATVLESKPYTCHLCSKCFRSHRGFSVHMTNHNRKNEFQSINADSVKQENADDTTFSCETCGKIFRKKSHLRIHVRDVHLKLQRAQCDVCDKYLNTTSSYRKHMKSHSNQQQYECDICSKIFPNRGCIIRHLKRHSKNKIKEKGKLCPICGKVLKPKSFYNHLQLHTGEKNFTCKKCRKTFASNAKRKEHEAIHVTNQTFNCNYCGKVFTCRRNCKNHEKYVHLKLRRVQCKICNKYLCSKTSYENHMKTHTGQWDYECDVCKKNFIHKSNIISHLRMHFGDRPYACQYCPSKFTDAKTLVEHERLHTGEKPYKCPFCEKAFAQKGNMKSHIRYNHKNTEPV